jgi:hypothetical protein
MPAGFVAFGIFLFFGASMAALAAVTLLHPGTALDRAWSLNRSAHAQLSLFGRVAGVMFLVLSSALFCAGVGWLRRRVWGWRLAVMILAIQAFGDLINLLRGELLKGTIGFTVACLLLFYLWRPVIRNGFRRDNAGTDLTPPR